MSEQPTPELPRVTGEAYVDHQFRLDSCPREGMHRLEDCTVEVGIMKHEFEGGREPNTANGPGESYSYCVNCGAEETDDNRDEECKPVEEDDSIVAPILPPYEG